MNDRRTPPPLTIRHSIDVFDRFLKKGFRVPLQVQVRAGTEDPAGTKVSVRWFELISTRQKIRVVSHGRVLGPLQAFAPPTPILANDPRDPDERHVGKLSMQVLAGREPPTIVAPHAITGETAMSDGGMAIHISIDGTVQGVDAERYECHRLEEVVGEIRQAAADIFHRENEGWFVPKPLPGWIVSRDYNGPQSWRVELREPTYQESSEMIFGLEGLEAARDFCRWMNRGVDGNVVGRILELGPTHAEIDVVGRLAMAATRQTRGMNLKVLDMHPSLVRDWHVVVNADDILAAEGGSGAKRILGGFVRLAAHLAEEGREPKDWASLLWRIEQEGLGVKPSTAAPGP